jgi:predicted amidohydrolase YtcJ
MLVLPGLIDAHVHAIATGMTYLDIDLYRACSLEMVATAVRESAGKGTEFVRLTGLDMSRFSASERTRLNREWLDDLLPDRPLFIKSVEGHSGWFNSLAWDRIKVDDVLNRLETDHARQEEMHAAGRVFGLPYENLTTPLYDSYNFDERREGMAQVIRRAQEAGLTGIHCMEGYGEYRRHDFELILELCRRDDIDLTLYCRDGTPDLAAELGVPRFGGCWCLDGAIGAHTAAVAEPYADKPESCGELYFSDDELCTWLESGLTRGMQTCVHAIGERALDQALRVLAGLAPRYDLRALRPRVDHFILGTPELATRAAGLGVLSAMQPAFDARWGGDSSGYAARLGTERALRTNPLGTALAAGMRIAGSSDSYITPLDPLGGIRAAMNHHNPAMRVDFDAAVRLFSEDAAYLAGQEQERGRIAEGFPADLTVVNGNRDMAADAQVAMTIKNGVAVYTRD